MDKEKQLKILKQAEKTATNPELRKDLQKKIAALENNKEIKK